MLWHLMLTNKRATWTFAQLLSNYLLPTEPNAFSLFSKQRTTRLYGQFAESSWRVHIFLTKYPL